MTLENPERIRWHYPEFEGFSHIGNSDGWPSNEAIKKAGVDFAKEPRPYSAEVLQKFYAKVWGVAKEDVKVIKLEEYMNMPPDVEYGIYRK